MSVTIYVNIFYYTLKHLFYFYMQNTIFLITRSGSEDMKQNSCNLCNEHFLLGAVIMPVQHLSMIVLRLKAYKVYKSCMSSESYIL